MKETVRNRREMIDDTLAASRYFKGETARMPAYGNLFLLDSRTYDVLTCLTETGDCLQPAWAPQGDRIVFVSAGK